ncbi:cobalamin B12-binding domain-containing protein [Candidatus Formimonas warabiya]|uniref:Cobalamin-binding protein n=1 Tax=Formimonas warabiya TaxID=1761012 RepID=A0A3G1KXN2_FORW1|nr:cobalamin-dependent protein [Candidatus Formimonas warabiya]ATW27283.1 cobalamin-binding protein [Candidatus Formimonas warabiya]
MSDVLINAMANLEEEKTLALVRERMQSGESALEIVEQCRKGVELVGKRYHQGSYFLSDLVMSEAIFQEVMKLVEPCFPVAADSIDQDQAPRVVMGTIEGDIHDLGKNIVIYILRAAGYQVCDLGVDVPAERFITALKETGATILGVCVVLNFCIEPVKRLIDLLREQGLKNYVHVIIGGSPVDVFVKDYTGADYYCNNAVTVLEIFDQISGVTRILPSHQR